MVYYCDEYINNVIEHNGTVLNCAKIPITHYGGNSTF